MTDLEKKEFMRTFIKTIELYPERDGGGREHAIIRALQKSPLHPALYCAPGNGGIGYDAACVDIKATDVAAMVAYAKENAIDYAVVAQDDPLALGMVDAMAEAGIPSFGLNAAAARIESS